MTLDPDRHERAGRLHRLQERIVHREEMRFAALARRKATLVAERDALLERYSSVDLALGLAAAAYCKRLAAIAHALAAIEQPAEEQRRKVAAETGRARITGRALDRLDQAAREMQQRRELTEILEARLKNVRRRHR